MKKATAVAPANIAFIKYWGKKQPALNIPYSDTISMNLSSALTMTSAEFDQALLSDEVVLNGRQLEDKELERVSRHLDLIRKLAKIKTKARVESKNSFPTSAGIASSASAFAALSVAGCAAAGLRLSSKQLSILARRGSGSASRSIPDGFVIWKAGSSDQTSFAKTLHPAQHWKLHDIVTIVDSGKKVMGSTEGHGLAPTSPLFKSRLKYLPSAISQLKTALAKKDIVKLGELIEAETLNMHAVMMTSQPSLFYWRPGTVAVIETLKALREKGVPAYFTLDAGPNVHVICEDKDAQRVKLALRKTAGVADLIDNVPSAGARLGVS